MIIELPQGWGKQRLWSWKAQTKSCAHQNPEERSVSPQETKSKLPANVGGLLWRHDLAGLTTEKRAMTVAVLDCSLGISPLGGHD